MTAATQTDEEIARFFHDTYERLAPSFGYETRKDTKQFEPTSANGKLMIAVCGEVAAAITKAKTSILDKTVCECGHVEHQRYSDHDECQECDCDAYRPVKTSVLVEEKEAGADSVKAIGQNTLLPCPFCGSEAALLDPGTGFHDVEEWTGICIKCGVKQRGDYKQDAIASWNRRAAPSVSDGGSSPGSEYSESPKTSIPSSGPIKLSHQHEQLIKEWAADSPHGDLWGNDEARSINLTTFARSILGCIPRSGVAEKWTPETVNKLVMAFHEAHPEFADGYIGVADAHNSAIARVEDQEQKIFAAIEELKVTEPEGSMLSRVASLCDSYTSLRAELASAKERAEELKGERDAYKVAHGDKIEELVRTLARAEEAERKLDFCKRHPTTL